MYKGIFSVDLNGLMTVPVLERFVVDSVGQIQLGHGLACPTCVQVDVTPNVVRLNRQNIEDIFTGKSSYAHDHVVRQISGGDPVGAVRIFLEIHGRMIFPKILAKT